MIHERSASAWLLLIVIFAGLGAAPSVAAAGRTGAAARVVVAVIEPDINVYHQEFRDSHRRGHPGELIPGYPRTARPLQLTLAARSLVEAKQKDSARWRNLTPGALYYLPGTKFTGLVHLPSPTDQAAAPDISIPPSSEPPLPVVDGYTFHGTGVASVLGGNTLGTCSRCDLVVVAADNHEDGLRWAAEQPWIDIVSNSWGGPLGVPTQATPAHGERAADVTASEGSRLAASRGKAVVFASGNGVTGLGATTRGTQHSLTWNSPHAGPPWVFTVGAAKARTGQPTDWHNAPVDVIAQGEGRTAADNLGLTGTMTFYGTSCSAPIAAGVLGAALLKARSVTGHRESANGGLVSTTRRPKVGPLTDGTLSYSELFDAARAVAQWREFDASVIAGDPMQAFVTPTTPVSYVYQGGGQLDKEHVDALTDVLLGRRLSPQRAELDEWLRANNQVRSSRWGDVGPTAAMAMLTSDTRPPALPGMARTGTP